MSSVTNRLIRNVFVGLALAGGAVSLAFAQSGVYVGAGIGQSKVKIECDLDITCSKDEKDTAFKFFGGYQFNPNIALEVGYVDLGEASANGTDSVLGTTSATWEASGFMVAAVGSIPIAERFALLGKVGLFRWDMDVSVSSSVFGSGSVSKTGTDLMFGLGGSMNLGRNLAVRVEWERFNDVGDENVTGEGDIDLLSASIVFRF